MVEQLDLGVRQDRTTLKQLISFWERTDVPAVIGIVISNTITLAVKTVASGTTDVGEHNMLPTFK